MTYVYIMLFIFAFGCVLGWGIEVIYRTYKGKKLVNPGFMAGPWLPIYGFGLLALFLMSNMESIISVENYIIRHTVLFLLMCVVLTCMEYIAGWYLENLMKVKLWDYSQNKYNVKGYICLEFSMYWLIGAIIYYYFIHPNIVDVILWALNSVSAYFSAGMFFGVFLVDLVYSTRLLVKIKQFADEERIVVWIDDLKNDIAKAREISKIRRKMFLTVVSSSSIYVHLSKYKDKLEDLAEDIREEFTKNKED